MGNRIREIRKAKGLTMKQLGEAVGVAESTISHYEVGRRQLDNEMLLKISEFLGVTVGYLLGVEDYMVPNWGESTGDILDAVDVAFYGEYKELDEDDKETVRDMVRIMRERRSRSQGK